MSRTGEVWSLRRHAELRNHSGHGGSFGASMREGETIEREGNWV